MARRWSTLLVETIDPVLAGTPFQAGQTGEPPTDDLPSPALRLGASVIWCGGYDEVIAAYPHLARPGVQPEENWCFDLMVEIDGGGRLVEVQLEHGDLTEAFAAMGRTVEASASAELLGRPAEVAVPELAALLARLFAPSAPRSDDGP
jgi:hypothetical protein